mgnify:CR=1 FL=1
MGTGPFGLRPGRVVKCQCPGNGTTASRTISNSTQATALLTDIFSAKLKELSGGKRCWLTNIPGAQPGKSTAASSARQVRRSSILQSFPQRTPRRSRRRRELCPCISCFAVKIIMVKALGDPRIFEAIRDMIDQTVQGIHVIGLGTQGLRSMYSKRDIRKIEDVKGLKIACQATATEDATLPAYGAQPFMPFGSAPHSLQTGVVDVGGERRSTSTPSTNTTSLRPCLDDTA